MVNKNIEIIKINKIKSKYLYDLFIYQAIRSLIIIKYNKISNFKKFNITKKINKYTNIFMI